MKAEFTGLNQIKVTAETDLEKIVLDQISKDYVGAVSTGAVLAEGRFLIKFVKNGELLERMERLKHEAEMQQATRAAFPPHVVDKAGEKTGESDKDKNPPSSSYMAGLYPRAHYSVAGEPLCGEQRGTPLLTKDGMEVNCINCLRNMHKQGMLNKIEFMRRYDAIKAAPIVHREPTDGPRKPAVTNNDNVLSGRTDINIRDEIYDKRHHKSSQCVDCRRYAEDFPKCLPVGEKDGLYRVVVRNGDVVVSKCSNYRGIK